MSNRNELFSDLENKFKLWLIERGVNGTFSAAQHYVANLKAIGSAEQQHDTNGGAWFGLMQLLTGKQPEVGVYEISSLEDFSRNYGMAIPFFTIEKKARKQIENLYPNCHNFEDLFNFTYSNAQGERGDGGHTRRAFIKYLQFLCELEARVDDNNIGKKIGLTNTLAQLIPWQLITYGAPGTGKSYKINQMAEAFDDYHKDRVTFYPTYTYQQFIGAYKPVMEDTKDTLMSGREISYEYVPGPFLRLLIKALLEPEQPFLIIIEEINRANAAAVFGDFFQLLDRGKDGTSEYPITINEDMKGRLQKEDKDNIIQKATFNYTKLSLPSNFYIWATMNSADQGVFPIDTAFKRRWDFEYLDINTNENEIKGKTFKFTDHIYEWNEIRRTINKALLEDAKVNEDKLLGPFFITKEIITKGTNDEFLEVFKSKVLMYLFEDAARHKPTSIFNTEKDNPLSFSNICERLDRKENGGLTNIFRFTIPNADPQKSSETHIDNTSKTVDNDEN